MNDAVQWTEHSTHLRDSASHRPSIGYISTDHQNFGAEGTGLHIAFSALDSGRLGIAAVAVGIAQAALDEAVRYANERTMRGQPIGRFQMIQSDRKSVV